MQHQLYNIYFELSSTILIIFFFFFATIRNHLDTPLNRKYTQLGVFVIATSIIDIITALLSNLRCLPSDSIVLNGLNTLYFLLIGFVGVEFHLYLATLVDKKNFYRSPLFLVLAISYIFYALFLFSNLFTHWIFYFDKDGYYCHGPLYLLVFILPLFYILLGFLFITTRKNTITRFQFSCTFFFCLCAFMGTLLQAIWLPHVLLSNFAIEISLIIIYFTLQTPDYYKLRETMKELEEAKTKAEVASQAKADFLANMSHEIRIPTNAVTGFAELILQDNDPIAMKDYAKDIIDSSEILLTVINDILDYSKMQSGKMQIVSVPYNFTDLLKNITSSFSLALAKKRLYLHCHYSEDLPTYLKGDCVRVKQILSNIISNAIKYTKEGGIDFTVSNAVLANNQIILTFTIKDTGIGIKEQNLDSIFQSFEQVDVKRNREVEGTGLGLAIAKNLAEIMGGDIHVESVYRAGSTFTITIIQEIDSHITVDEHKKNALSFQQQYPKATVLVVDDTLVNLKLTEALLNKYEIQTTCVTSGRQALKYLSKRQPDLIFMDHMMPELDGVETVQLIREIPGDYYATVPIIALTANGVEGIEEFFLNHGFQGLILKPIDMNHLAATLDHYLGK